MNKVQRKAVECIFRKYLHAENLEDALVELKDTFGIEAKTEFEKIVEEAFNNSVNLEWVKISSVFNKVDVNKSQILLFSKILDSLGVQRKRNSKERLVLLDMHEMKKVEQYLIDGFQMSDIHRY